MTKVFLFFFFFIPVSIWGEIVEAQNFKDIHSYLVTGTLVVLDIDDTLLVPVQMLGCDEWFQCRIRYHQKAGFTTSESLEKSIAEWEAVRHLTKMEIVEPGTEEIVHKLQDQGYAVMGLTTQGLALATRTKQQLLDNHIDLMASAPSREDCFLLVEGHAILFRAGVLFSSGAHKGKALFALLDKLGYLPKRILFINDKRSNLLPIEEVAREKGVEFIGLRYAYSDARKAAFSEEIAHFQFSHSTFTHILSDEEARKQLSTKIK